MAVETFVLAEFRNRSKKPFVDWCIEMLKKYDGGASKDVYKIATADKSWICAYEPETKQQFNKWAFEDKPNPTKVVCEKSTSKQMVGCFFGKTGHVTTVPLEQRCTVNSEWYTISLEKFEKRT